MKNGEIRKERKDTLKYLYIYLAVINVVAFVLMSIDKYRACRHRWRIPERTLFVAAILGGSLGSLLGMWILWHKIRNKLFVIGLPVVFILQLTLVLLLRR